MHMTSIDNRVVKFKKNILSIRSNIVLFSCIDIVVIIILVKYFNIWILGIFILFNFLLISLRILYPTYFLTNIVIDTDYGVKWIYKNSVLQSLAWEEIKSIKRIPVSGTQSIIFNGDEVEKYCNIYKSKLRAIISVCPDEKLRADMSQIKLFI